MKKISLLTILLILSILLISCVNKDNDNISGEIMKLTVISGGTSTGNEEKIYTITAEGQVTDNNGISKQLSDKDFEIIYDYYEKYCNKDVSSENEQILDGPTYKLLVTDKIHMSSKMENNSHIYEWSFDKQDSYVKEIRDIISEYYND